MDEKYRISQSFKEIEAHIAHKLTVEHLANHACFSRCHYSRLFRELVGSTVMEYVTKRRLTLAGKALLETNQTVLDIALQFGFDSHEGFTRSFKAYMGITPTEYRKYRLATITQPIGKEKSAMLYAKITNSVIRELNQFIVMVKEAAKSAENCGITIYQPFWNSIAHATGQLAGQIESMLGQIGRIADHPDELNRGLQIISAMDHIAWQTNLLVFHIGITISRGQPQDIEAQKLLCEIFDRLMQASQLKKEKITEFMWALATRIMDDMKKSAQEHIATIAGDCNRAAQQIQGHAYIQEGLRTMAEEISNMPFHHVTVSMLEGHLSQIQIISLATQIDGYRNPDVSASFDGIQSAETSLHEAVSFFQMFSKADTHWALQKKGDHQYNAEWAALLLFYLKGEVSDEKLGKLLSVRQKAELNAICDSLSACVKGMTKAEEQGQISSILHWVKEQLAHKAVELKKMGGVIQFLSAQIEKLIL